MYRALPCPALPGCFTTCLYGSLRPAAISGSAVPITSRVAAAHSSLNTDQPAGEERSRRVGSRGWRRNSEPGRWTVDGSAQSRAESAI